MNWDKKAFLEAWDLADSEFYAREPEQLFTDGAQWQRDQLRTNEAVEIVARAIARLDPGEEWPNETIIDDECRDECHETALAAITALLGGSDSE